MTDLSPAVQGLLDESYESDLTEEESEELLLLCGHGIGPKLSSAAQAVLDAANGRSSYGPDDCLNESRWIAAAALRAAAEEPLYGGDQRWMFERDARQACRKKFLALAAELEGGNG
jgi:hypothetical protein